MVLKTVLSMSLLGTHGAQTGVTKATSKSSLLPVFMVFANSIMTTISHLCEIVVIKFLVESQKILTSTA
jgi:hypothetical protein